MDKIEKPASPSPIFIGGMFKSGTTLLRAMLSQHSRIAAGLETYWFDLDWTHREDEVWRRQIVRIAGLFDLPEGDVLKLADAVTGAEQFLDCFMSEVASRQGKPRWAEKTPGNVAHVDRILDYWPRARIVHILRDPRDIYASLLEAGKVSEPEQFVRRWMTIVPHAEEFARQPRLAHSLLALRYEDLIARPEGTMRRVLAFLGEPWEPAVAHFAGRDDEYDKVLRVTGKVSTTLARMRKPITDERVGLWRRLLGERGANDLLSTADRLGSGPLMRRLVAETPGAT